MASGVAIALAQRTPTLQPGETRAVSFGFGAYEGKSAVSFGIAHRFDYNSTADASIWFAGAMLAARSGYPSVGDLTRMVTGAAIAAFFSLLSFCATALECVYSKMIFIIYRRDMLYRSM